MPDAYAAVALAAEAEASKHKDPAFNAVAEELQKAVGMTPEEFVNSGPGYMGRIFNGAPLIGVRVSLGFSVSVRL